MENTAINKTLITANDMNGIIHQPVDDYTEYMIDIANLNKLEYYEINEINEEMMKTFDKSMITDDNDSIIINNEYRSIMQFSKLYMQLFWALPLKMHKNNMTTEMLASHEWSIRTAVYMIQTDDEGFHNALFDSDARVIDFYSKHYTHFTPEECDEAINQNRIDVLINMLGNNNAYIYPNHDLFDGTGPDEWFSESALTRRRIAKEFKNNKQVRLAVAKQRNDYNYDNIHNGQYNMLIDDPDEEVRMAALASYYNVNENTIRTMRIAEPWLAGNYDNDGSDKIDYYFRMFDCNDYEAINGFYANHPQARLAIQDEYYKQYSNGHRHEHMPLDSETALRNMYKKYGLTK